MRKTRHSLVIAILGFLVACGGDSTGTGSSANVKIIGIAGSGAVNVENIGGSGDFRLEFWAPNTLNSPSGPGQIVLISTSPTRAVSAGYAGAVANPTSNTTRIVAKSRSTGGSGFFTSDCYGTGC